MKAIGVVLLGMLAGVVIGAGAGGLIGWRVASPGGWALVGGIGGGLGATLALWGMAGSDRSPATWVLGVGLFAGGLGGVVAGSIDGGVWDLVPGGLWGLLPGLGLGVAGLLALPVVGRMATLGLVGGAAATAGAALFHADAGNLPEFLRLAGGALAGLCGVVLACRAGVGLALPGAGLLVTLAATAVLVSVFLVRSPLVASLSTAGRVATLSDDGTVVVVAGGRLAAPEVIDLAAGSRRPLPAAGPGAADVALTPDGKLVLAGAVQVSIWGRAPGRVLFSGQVAFEVVDRDTRTGKTTTRQIAQMLQKVVTLPGSRLALLGVGAGDWLGSDLALWELPGGAVLVRAAAHADGLTALAATPDGQRGVSGGKDGTLALWRIDPNLGELDRWRSIEVSEEPIVAVAITADARWIAASVAGNPTIGLWDADTGEVAGEFRGHGDTPTTLAFLPDGRLLSGSTDGTLRLWDVASRTEQWRCHVQGKVASMKLDAAGRCVLVATEAGRLRLYRVP